MDKSPDAFRTISEVSDHLDTPAHVLRFWESRFPQVRPVKRAGGRRYYRPSDVALLAGIRRLLHDEGLTIRGVQKILREQGVRHVAGLAEAAPADGDLVETVATRVEGEAAPVLMPRAGREGPDAGAPDPADGPADEWDDDWGSPDEAEAPSLPATQPLVSPVSPPPSAHEDLPLFAAPRGADPVPQPVPAEPPKAPLTGLRALRAATPPVVPLSVAPVFVPVAGAPEVDLAPVLARLRALDPGALAPHREAIAALSVRLEALRAAPGRPPRGARG